jgi:hypothetical protein
MSTEKAIISGYIVDETGNPLSGVEVKLSLKSEQTLPIYKVSDGGTINFDTEIGQLTREYRPIYTSPNGGKKSGKEAFYTTDPSQFEYLAQSLLDYYFEGQNLILIKFQPLIPSLPKKETLINGSDGYWKYETEATNIAQYGGVDVSFSKEKYTNKDIKGVQQTFKTAIDNPLNNIFYDIPRTTLNAIPDPAPKLTKEVEAEQKVEENKVRKEELKSKLPTEAKLTNLFNEKKETIKKTLIPFAVALILEFGTTAAQDIINKKVASIDKCPSSANIAKLIKKRNQLVQQLNNLYSSITVLTKTIDITSASLAALNIGIQLILSLPYPATGIPPYLPPLTSGVIQKIGDAKELLKNALAKGGVVISLLTMTLASIGALLGTIIQILNQLDNLLAQCAEDQNMDLEQINNEINALANAAVTATQSEDNTYKGFILAVKIDEKNNSKYIKRYAVAQNKQSIDVLRTDSSFASDPAVLISQLKFIIDSNPNITAE